jgi:hypothetical protein
MDASGDVKPHCKGQYFDFWKVAQHSTFSLLPINPLPHPFPAVYGQVHRA